jgi:hypothetical protein
MKKLVIHRRTRPGFSVCRRLIADPTRNPNAWENVTCKDCLEKKAG